MLGASPGASIVHFTLAGPRPKGRRDSKLRSESHRKIVTTLMLSTQFTA
jgi:hypothetical protein